MSVSDRIANLFPSEQTRGLSGGSRGGIALDASNPYYNFRLRQHQAAGDLVDDPRLLWDAVPGEGDPSGLGAHLSSERAGGAIGFTDVLLVLSRDDHERAMSDRGWLQDATRAMLQSFDDLCRREGMRRRFAHRQLGFRVLCDGSAEMGGQAFGLEAGEFVTGLLPNLYTGPVKGSRPVIDVFLNIPGEWEGYEEIGRLYDDQVLFTLGNHWLDNFSHPALREAALYRLQEADDGGFVHVVNPDLQDRYEVTSAEQDGASVLTLATRDGTPLAYVLLVLHDEVEHDDPPELSAPERPRGIAPPMLIDDDVQPVPEPARAEPRTGGRTVLPDAPSERILSFQERGALLQKVHFGKFMAGYDVFVGRHGQLGTGVESPAATFQVRKQGVSLLANTPGVEVNGIPVETGFARPLEGNAQIRVAGELLEYRDLAGLDVDGWPYVAEIRRPASSTYMVWGDSYLVGRSRDCRVRLPDEPRNDNIHWKPSVGDGATIRVKTGEIPKSRFYTDSIMVASEHAEIDLAGDTPRAVCRGRNTYTFVRREGYVHPLYPTSSGREPREMTLRAGDELLVGNCVFHIGFASAADAAPTPEPPSLDASDAPPVPAFASPEDAPAPAGLGLRGAAPPPIPIERVGAISLSGDLDDFADFGLHDDADYPDDEATIPGAPLPSGLAEALGASSRSVGAAMVEDDDDIDDIDDAPPAPEPPAEPEPVDDDDSFDEDSWDDERANVAPDPDAAPLDARVPPPFPELADDAEPPAPALLRGEAEVADAPAPEGRVVAVDDADAQFELGRTMHLVQIGWAVNGVAVCGNHTGADLVLPESRLVPDQSFAPVDYFELMVRGRKGHLDVRAPGELFVDEAAAEARVYEEPEQRVIDVVRRDDQGDDDFVVRLTITRDRALPDPRARLVAIDVDEPLVAALFTKGLPTRAPRTLEIAGLRVDATFDGEVVRLTDYLDTYRQGDGFRPFFVRQGGGRFRTAPEDGAEIVVSDGDRIVVGNCVFELRRV